MLLEFGVKNFRSIKDEAVFSLIANDNVSKLANVFTHKLATGEEIRLLKSAAIFGANASGKSNVLKALSTFLFMIHQNHIEAGEEIEYYNPFKFNMETREQPISFWMSFVGPNEYKYKYSFSFDWLHIVEEKLEFYLNGISKSPEIALYREKEKNDVHIGKLSESNKQFKVFHNQLFLSKFGKDVPHETITSIFTYFKRYAPVYVYLEKFKSYAENYFTKEVKDKPKVKKKLVNLLRLADTKLYNITINSYFETIKENKKQLRTVIDEKDIIDIVHEVFNDREKVGTDILNIQEESDGTQQLLYIGGLILDVLDQGGILFIDEIDSSLHPLLVKTLLELVQSKKLNPKNAQVVFTTHDMNVLNHNLYRRDQYWFTEKNKFGETELYSMQDFEKVNEYTPFNSWYMAGKFGAIPKIQSIEKILDGENEEG